MAPTAFLPINRYYLYRLEIFTLQIGGGLLGEEGRGGERFGDSTLLGPLASTEFDLAGIFRRLLLSSVSLVEALRIFSISIIV